MGKEDIMAEARRELASQGGRARAKSLSPQERQKISKKAIRARWDSTGPSYTYFVCSQDRKNVKIGCTVNVSSRLRSIHCNPGNQSYCSGKRVVLLGIFRNRGEFSEIRLQQKFSSCQISPCHEWFRLTKRIIQFLKDNRENMVEPIPDLELILRS